MKETPNLHAKCPVCGQPVTLEYKPFCSKRCADVDLGRWMKGCYVVHTEERPIVSDLDILIGEFGQKN